MADWGFLSDVPRHCAAVERSLAAKRWAWHSQNRRAAVWSWHLGVQWQHIRLGSYVCYLAWSRDAAGGALFDQRLAVPLLGRNYVGSAGGWRVNPRGNDAGDEHLDTAFNYIRRRGRFTKAQAQALDALADKYRWRGDLDNSPLGVEIGFGMGYELLAWAEQQPSWYLLGVELYQPGIGSMLSRLQKKNLQNVGLVDEPAQLLFERLPQQSIDEVRIFFPDPWPKKRHFKRRLIQPEFLHQLHGAMKNHGLVRLATDWAEYAEWMVEHFAAHPGFELIADEIREEPSSAMSNLSDGAVRDVTKFEARGQRLGHAIRDLQYRRTTT